MDLQRFDSELAELLADDAAPDRERRLAELRRAAAAYPGGRELVALLERPAHRRDPVPDPGPRYWDGFAERLAERIRAGERRERSRLLLAVAASIVAALGLAAGLWLFGGDARPTLAGAGVELPDDLARRLEQAAGEETPGIDLVQGVADPWQVELSEELGPDDDGNLPEGDGWLFPETYTLDPEARRELMEWLREQAGRPARERA